MQVDFEAVIGLEVHAEMQTESKMFCACPVVDFTVAEANTAVCPVCAGMPGTLPVINQKVVEYALRVALALGCEIAHTSIFARKNYFYPDLPKGYQISQYEQPLAINGSLTVQTSQGEHLIHVRRVHIEEDTGKLTHINEIDEDGSGEAYSLVDLNRAGVALLEIVTEPDIHTAEEACSFATALRSVLRYLGVNSGNMQKGVIRFEANVSVRQVGSEALNTRVEIKNLNSFRALERSIDYEINRQIELLKHNQEVVQETLGWDENRNITVPQRSKEDADDYRYFPEPDLPPLVVSDEWIDDIRANLPELPGARFHRFQSQYGLGAYDADVLVADKMVADYFETTVASAGDTSPKLVANWVCGELFSLMNQNGLTIENIKVSPQALGSLIHMTVHQEINQNTAKSVLDEMFTSGLTAEEIVTRRGLRQVSDIDQIAANVCQVLVDNPEQVVEYLAGKETLLNWLFGQAMRAAGGRANPQVLRGELERQLKSRNT
jgi:aspartyl-tRNA(Asn)/glutamyl-tRNA(Gln) amidotransferase subunit B